MWEDKAIQYYNFSQALSELKSWKKIQRKGWNWKWMHLELQTPDKHSKMTLPYIYMNIIIIPDYNNDCEVEYNRVPWLASQTDILESDWIIL